MSLCATASALVALALPSAGADLQRWCAERPAAAAAAPPAAVPARPAPRDASPPRRATLAGALRRAHHAGELTWHERRRAERELHAARRAARRLPAARARELTAVLATADGLAAERRLPAARLRAV